MFPALRNFELSDWKMIEIRISPTITGRTPGRRRSRITQAVDVLGEPSGHDLGRTASAASGCTSRLDARRRRL